MRRWRQILFIAVAVVLAGVAPHAVVARSARMQAVRQLPIAVQSERQAALDQSIGNRGALGWYWDQSADQIVVVVPASGRSSFRTADVDALGLDLRIETRAIERSDIDDIGTFLMNWRWNPSARGTPFVSYFDPKQGRVVIASGGPRDVFDSLLERYPGEIEYVQDALEVQGRHDDGPPHWGGAEINSGGVRCTSGFTVRQGGSIMMLTAKHCALTLWQIVYGGTGLGWGQVRAQGSITETDLIGNASYNGHIYTTGNNGKSVSGASNPVSWNYYCQSGQYSGETCGHSYAGLTGTECMPAEWGGGCYSGLAMFTGGLLPYLGDSGGPWYYYDPSGRVYVAGIHTGTLTGTSIMVASVWSRIVADLGVTIVTS